MRVVIDAERCTGHGRCYELAATVFTDNEDGYGQVRDEGTVSAGAEKAARMAVAACPERAISILDESN
jgi:ferredoxin